MSTKDYSKSQAAKNCLLNMQSLYAPCATECNLSGVRRVWMAPLQTVTGILEKSATSPSKYEDYVTLGTLILAQARSSAATAENKVGIQTVAGMAYIYSTKDMGELKYAVQGAVMGQKSLHATLEMHHPSFRRKAHGWFYTLLNQELLVVVELMNGEYHLLGSMKRGATLADGSEGTSGKAVTDQAGYTVTLEWDTCVQQVLFDGYSAEEAYSFLLDGEVSEAEETESEKTQESEELINMKG